MHVSPVLLKIIYFAIFWTDETLRLFVSLKKITSKNVYVMFMFTPWHLLERYI